MSQIRFGISSLPENYFTLRDARLTLASSAEGTGLEGSIYAGLKTLTESLLDKEWHRDDGTAMKIECCLIDANWSHSTNVVYQFCRQSPFASPLLPSHGRFVDASPNPFSEYKRRSNVGFMGFRYWGNVTNPTKVNS